MMRKVLNSIHMEGVVVIGEGEKDEVSTSKRLLERPTQILLDWI
jgi:hypothetical protein